MLPLINGFSREDFVPNEQKDIPVRGEADLAAQIQNALHGTDQPGTSTTSRDGADLTVPLSQEEMIQSLLYRLENMAKSYTIGLDDSNRSFFDSLAFINENFFFDRPLTPQDFASGGFNSFKQRTKAAFLPFLQNILRVIFERQRGFNGELVKILNRLTETFGRQRDFNMDLIKFCERMIEHYRLMESMERRLDDFFSYTVRIAVLEEEVEILKEKVVALETQEKKPESKMETRDITNQANSFSG
jgi:hypothetical protein